MNYELVRKNLLDITVRIKELEKDTDDLYDRRDMLAKIIADGKCVHSEEYVISWFHPIEEHCEDKCILCGEVLIKYQIINGVKHIIAQAPTTPEIDKF